MYALFWSELSDGTVEAIDGSATGHIRVSDTQLFLTFADIDDSGLYVCNATNNIGFDTSTAHLSVLGKYTVTKHYIIRSVQIKTPTPVFFYISLENVWICTRFSGNVWKESCIPSSSKVNIYCYW